MTQAHIVAPWHPEIAAAPLAADTRQHLAYLLEFHQLPDYTSILDRAEEIARLVIVKAPQAYRVVLPTGPGYLLPALARAFKDHGLQPTWAIPPAAPDGSYTLLTCY